MRGNDDYDGLGQDQPRVSHFGKHKPTVAVPGQPHAADVFAAQAVMPPRSGLQAPPTAKIPKLCRDRAGYERVSHYWDKDELVCIFCDKRRESAP